MIYDEDWVLYGINPAPPLGSCLHQCRCHWPDNELSPRLVLKMNNNAKNKRRSIIAVGGI